jgi:CO/xanthine dehydrogenase FAD-binding subunit
VISIAMVAAIIEADAGGRIARARVAVGACSEVARRLPELEVALAGAAAAPASAGIATAEHLAALSPIDDVRGSAAYRREAALTVVRRALERALEVEPL